ncbi:expressed unknown protein [Seminavis robusta]|uniref:Uncharacterized protein n=1 Tax=Seminavis robusta TaxID=568900 RepID=A0A9N8ETP5_9STRA|nr:expressed unknown protein [Seminavis robusta]|eukprot:Sro1791_g297770.1 n/a (124) ;mRNA; f:1464-1835
MQPNSNNSSVSSTMWDNDWSQDISMVLDSSEPCWSEDISDVVSRSSLSTSMHSLSASMHSSPQQRDAYGHRIARRAERSRRRHAQAQTMKLKLQRSRGSRNLFSENKNEEVSQRRSSAGSSTR